MYNVSFPMLMIYGLRVFPWQPMDKYMHTIVTVPYLGLKFCSDQEFWRFTACLHNAIMSYGSRERRRGCIRIITVPYSPDISSLWSFNIRQGHMSMVGVELGCIPHCMVETILSSAVAPVLNGIKSSGLSPLKFKFHVSSLFAYS